MKDLNNISSDWEDLFSKPEASASAWQAPTHPCARSSNLFENNKAEKNEIDHEFDDSMKDLSSSSPGASTLLKALKPLCISVNQNYTRVGVGHESGFIVFKVQQDIAENHEDIEDGSKSENANNSEKQRAEGLEKGKSSPRTLSHLVVDSTYNTDLQTFSTIRRRAQTHLLRVSNAAKTRNEMNRFQRDHKQANASLSRSFQDEEPRSTRATEAMKLFHADAGKKSHPGKGKVRNFSPQGEFDAQNERLISESNENLITEAKPSLNLFLSCATLSLSGSQIFENDADVYAGSSRQAENKKENDQVQQREERGLDWEKGNPSLSFFPSKKGSTEKDDIKKGESFGLSEIAQMSNEVDITLETKFSSSTLVPSLSHPPPDAKKIEDNGDDGQPPHTCLLWNTEDDDDDDDEEEEEEKEAKSSPSRLRFPPKGVGFGGGGVGLLALLYEQPRLAVVGGGEAPMGSPREIILITGGVVFNVLNEPHPVRQLLLDARVLISITSQEVRFYANPMEPHWTACQYVVPLQRIQTAPLGEAVASVLSGKEETRQGNLAKPNALEKDEEEMAPELAPRRVPFAIDYARNLLLTRGGEGWNRFILLHFSTSAQVGNACPQPSVPFPGATLESASLPRKIQANEGESAEGPFRGAMPTAIRVKVVAVSPHDAHRNPLDQLALYIGRTPFPARLRPPQSPPTAFGLPSLLSSLPLFSSYPPLLSPSLAPSSDEVMLVATCSVFATRITLWMFTPIANKAPTLASPMLVKGGEKKPAGGEMDSYDVNYTFTQIRVFRVGFRMPIHPFAIWKRHSRPHEDGSHAFSLPHPPKCGGGRESTTKSGIQRADEDEARAGTPQILQLQFLHQGCFVFCVRSGEMLVFSTTEEDPSERVAGAADPPQASVNHRSMFSTAFKCVVPGRFRFFHDYARQEWFSCRAPLPLHDPVFYPRWLWMYKQDLLASGDPNGRLSRSHPYLMKGDHSVDDSTVDANGREVEKMGSFSGKSRTFSYSRFGKWVSQLTHATGGKYFAITYPVKSSTRKEPLDGAPLNGITTLLGAPFDESSNYGDEKDKKGIFTQPLNTAPLSVNSPSPSSLDRSITQIEPCIFLWEHDLARLTVNLNRYGPTNAPLSFSCAPQTTTSSLAEAHRAKSIQKNNSHSNITYSNKNTEIVTRKVVLDCVTCDGAFLNIRLYTKQGTLLCSPALPCTLE